MENIIRSDAEFRRKRNFGSGNVRNRGNDDNCEKQKIENFFIINFMNNLPVFKTVFYPDSNSTFQTNLRKFPNRCANRLHQEFPDRLCL